MRLTNAQKQQAYRDRQAARVAAAREEALQALQALGSPSPPAGGRPAPPGGPPAGAGERSGGLRRRPAGQLPLKRHMCNGPRRDGHLAPGPDHQASDGPLTR